MRARTPGNGIANIPDSGNDRNAASFLLLEAWRDLRPAKNITELHAAVEPVVPYAANLASTLPKRFEWSYQLAVPSKDVPLTDSLVMVFRTTDGRIAARVAARL